MGTTGKQPDGVETYPADQHDLDSYRQAETQLAELRIPALLHAGNPHKRLFIAGLDGTGNSMFDDSPENWSVVAKIAKQIEKLEDSGVKNIAGGYVEGTFTQNGLLNTPKRLADGRFGITFEDRVETAYFQLCTQAKIWLEENPQAQVRVVGVGFSRGAEEVAALQRMVEERGIRNPDGVKFTKDKENLITHIEYADRPLLVPPGRTLQVALLFDPVATGVEGHRRDLPGSTMTTFQIGAEDERRNLFKSSDHIPTGFSENKRNLGVSVGGAHSDIGNTYEKNGLGVLSFNLGVKFLNRLSDTPYLQEQVVPDDPAQFVVHRSEQGMFGLYGTSDYDKNGLRGRTADQSPQPGVQQKDPISEELEKQIERRTDPARERERSDATRNEFDRLFDNAIDAYLNDDIRAFRAAMQEYRQSGYGQAWAQEQHDYSQGLRAQEQQDALQQQAALAEQQRQAQAMQGPSFSR